MTEVTFFEDFHCFEYHTPRGAPQRFCYYMQAPVYAGIPFLSACTTHRDLAHQRTVFSSDFIPLRLTRRREDG